VVKAVLLDRDGTLVVDRPGNADPSSLQLMPYARAALALLRDYGMRVAVVTNQAALADGTVTWNQVEKAHEQIEFMAGPIDAWYVCPHGERDGCACRKPKPELVVRAADDFGVKPSECVVVGDIGTDMDAATAAGALGVIVPTPNTLSEEVAHAPYVAPTLLSAAVLIVEGRL
jgi:D-glycero-D-manno-heptose 1,7-bisphosphate phosphatase